MKKYPTYSQLNLSQITKDILQSWKEKNTFEKSYELPNKHNYYGSLIVFTNLCSIYTNTQYYWNQMGSG